MPSTRTRRAPRNTSTGCWRSASPLPRRRPFAGAESPAAPSGAAGSVTAVIAAAGSGERLGAGGPKAFVPLGGRPMVEWSIAAFRAVAGVRSIIVACPPGHVHDLAGGDLGLVDGGETRAISVAKALAAVGTELVVVHDAARPFVTARLIEAVIATLAADPEADGAIAAVPVSDTIKRVGEVAEEMAQEAAVETNRTFSTDTVANVRFMVTETVDRGRLWAAQTPQAFRTGALRRALEANPEAAAAATDEAMVIEAAGGRVLIHESTTENLKVTTPFDLEVAAVLAAVRES